MRVVDKNTASLQTVWDKPESVVHSRDGAVSYAIWLEREKIRNELTGQRREVVSDGKGNIALARIHDAFGPVRSRCFGMVVDELEYPPIDELKREGLI